MHFRNTCFKRSESDISECTVNASQIVDVIQRGSEDDFQYAVGQLRNLKIRKPDYYKLERTCFSTPRKEEDIHRDVIEPDLLKHIKKSLVFVELRIQHGIQHCRITDLGHSDDFQTWKMAIMLENNISTEIFDYSEPEPLDPFIDTDRLDLTNLLTFTIDPPNAADNYDAVSCELRNGIYRVGVHIADVSAYIAKKSELDRDASARGTTVYLQNETVPMLPAELVEKCLLLAGKDRRTISIIFDITSNGRIIKQSGFFKSRIRSRADLTYEDAQDIIDGKIWQNDMQLTRSVRNLKTITPVLRHIRWEKDQPISMGECKPVQLWDFRPTEETKTEMKQKLQYDSQEIIAELALLTNRTAAEKIFKKYPNQCLLRRHGEPFTDALQLAAKNCGFDNVHTPLSRGDIRPLLEQCRSHPISEAALKAMVVKAMQSAQYVNPADEDSFHYALGMEHYTHMTSPIRRYADIVVHRMLLGQEYSRHELQLIIDRCNNRKDAAKCSANDNWNLYMGDYIKNNPAFAQQSHRAVITGILPAEFAMEVFVIDYAIRKKTYVSSRKDKRIANCLHALSADNGGPRWNQFIITWKKDDQSEVPPERASEENNAETLEVWDVVSVKFEASTGIDPREFSVVFAGKGT
ncbi:uncharacterized protein LOC129586442 isoform X2 [Paramacrobiotus metropolitanus]|uniref:uncharacterized protein LOC129586442 isoform X2 n=1 Tax=Paramacrobiotus metropolitanus TaxID=2943436 RepID=UPI002445783B|nr:uncharacterized protein LOC129586442 isoform X2 [Paramacrobiotus metropolitanus]